MRNSDSSIHRLTKTLFYVAHSEKKTKIIYNDLLRWKKIISESKELQTFLGRYDIKNEVRKAVLLDICANGFDQVTERFIIYLEKERFIAKLPKICERFEALYHDDLGITNIVVVTSHSLSHKQKESLHTSLSEKFTSHIEEFITENANLLGGFVIQIGDLVYDFSVVKQLDTIRKKLIE